MSDQLARRIIIVHQMRDTRGDMGTIQRTEMIKPALDQQMGNSFHHRHRFAASVYMAGQAGAGLEDGQSGAESCCPASFGDEGAKLDSSRSARGQVTRTEGDDVFLRGCRRWNQDMTLPGLVGSN